MPVCKCLKWRVFYATVGFDTAAAANPITVPTEAPGEGTSFKPPMTEAQGRAWDYANAGNRANAIAKQLEDQGVTGTSWLPRLLENVGENAKAIGAGVGGGLGTAGGVVIGLMTGGVGLVGTGAATAIGTGLGAGTGALIAQPTKDLANAVRDPAERRLIQAKMTFIDAILRDESGAAITAEEFHRYDQKYFAQPGDDKATIRQKQQARMQAILTKQRKSGRPLLPLDADVVQPQTPRESGVVEMPGGEKVKVRQTEPLAPKNRQNLFQ